MSKYFLILLFIQFGSDECSKILILHPTISQSHVIPLQVLAKELAAKGHQITYVTTFPSNKLIRNYREIEITINQADKEFFSKITKDPKSVSIVKLARIVPSLACNLGNDTLQSPQLRKLMNEEEFDLLILGFFMNEFMLGLADHFKCPSIVFTPAAAFGMLNQMIGNPLSVTTVPVKTMTGKLDKFTSRLKNFLMAGGEMMFNKYLQYRAKQIYR